MNANKSPGIGANQFRAYFGELEINFILEESAGFISGFTGNCCVTGNLHSLQCSINFDGIFFFDSRGVTEFKCILLMM